MNFRPARIFLSFTLLKQIKGREIQMSYMIKSAVAQRYYHRLGRELDREAARKKFNQEWIDLRLLVEVMKEAGEADVERIQALRDEQ